MSGFQLNGLDITASADDINRTKRSYDDGVVEPNTVLVSDAGGNVSFSGGGIDFASSLTSTPYGYVKDFELGGHSRPLTTYTGSASSTGINILTNQGECHKIILANSKTRIAIPKSDQMLRDATSSTTSTYYLKLFFQQDSTGGHEWAWNTDSINIRWEPTAPSGRGTTAYTSGIPLINDSGAVYSGGILGGHTATGSEIDIVEMWSLDLGGTWYAKRVASGII